MRILNKLVSIVLCLVLLLNATITVLAEESSNNAKDLITYQVPVISNEYMEKTVVFYEHEGKYYLDIEDIKDFTRSTISETDSKIVITHGIRELEIDKSTGHLIDSTVYDQGTIPFLVYEDKYLCEGISMLMYLGAACTIRDEVALEVLMPSITIWESIMPDYLDYYFNITELYGGEDNVKISLICDILSDVLDGVSGHGLFADGDTHLEDALFEILEIDMMKYASVQEEVVTKNQDINDFLSSEAVGILLESGSNTTDAVSEVLDYYADFYLETEILKNNIRWQHSYNVGDLESASNLSNQINSQVYEQSSIKANLGTYKNLADIMDLGMIAFDTAVTSYSLMQYDDDTKHLFAKTINDETFDYVGYNEISWTNVSNRISNKLSSNEAIIASTAVEKLTEYVAGELAEGGTVQALSAFTSKANIYVAATQIATFVSSLINRDLHEAYSADMNAIWLSAVQYDIARLTTQVLLKVGEEEKFSNAESIEKLKDMLTLYYRTTIAFSENIAVSIDEFGSKNKDEWVKYFSSTTDASVANYAAQYLYRITNCTIVPIVKYVNLSNELLNSKWLEKFEKSNEFMTSVAKPSDSAIEISTAKELYEKIQNNPDGDFVIKCDIDLNTYNSGEWIPLCGPDYDDKFTGTLDGQGHVIKNLNITNSDFAGLFYRIDNGTIKNLGIEANKIIGKSRAGGIAAVGSGTVYNCYVTCAEISAEEYAGGVFACDLNDSTLEYVTVKANVCANVKASYSMGSWVSYGAAGGLIGDNTSNIKVKNIIIQGIIEGQQSGEAEYGNVSAGGIIGESSSTTTINIEAVNVSGSISTTTRYGTKKTLSSGTILCSGPGAYAGGIIGKESHDYGSGHFTYDNSISINKCIVDADVCVNSCNAAYAGGLIATTNGLNENDVVVSIQNCEYTGNIKAITSESVGSITFAGGVFGSCYSSALIKNTKIYADVLAQNGIYSAKVGKISASGNDEITTEEVNGNIEITAENPVGKTYIEEIQQ